MFTAIFLAAAIPSATAAPQSGLSQPGGAPLAETRAPGPRHIEAQGDGTAAPALLAEARRAGAGLAPTRLAGTRRPGAALAPALAEARRAGAALAGPPSGAGLHFIDVGQGSALLVLGPAGHAVMIDSGPPGAAEAVVHALELHAVTRLDLWIHTHFDADHVGGAARVAAGADGSPGSDDDLELADLWDRGLAGAPATEAVRAYAALAGERRREVHAGATWRAPGLTIAAVDTGAPGELAAENARGLALCVELGPLRLLAPGDLPAAQAAVAAAACGPVDVLWASHHGGADGLTDELLAAADPALVVVSAGRDNPYCHPAPITLARLHARTVWISGLAGAGPLGACAGLAPALGPDHRLIAGDMWLAAEP